MGTTGFRETFSVTRLSQFTNPAELQAEFGFPIQRWPAVICKELIDNAIDAGEDDPDYYPWIKVTTGAYDDGTYFIRVQGNGPGIPPDVVERLRDLTRRTSSRAAYAGLSRGSQGNAFSLILGATFCAGEPRGAVRVVSHDVRHTLRLEVDDVTREPVVRHSAEPAASDGWTVVEVTLPLALDDEDLSRILFWAGLSNPAATINEIRLGDPKKPRWRNSERPLCAWFTAERFGILAAAKVREGRNSGGSPTVHEFATAFQGMTSNSAVSRVLGVTGMLRMALQDALFDVADDGVSRLRVDQAEALQAAIITETEQVRFRPTRLGVLGRDAIAAHPQVAEVIAYKVAEVDSAGTPAIVEGALVALVGGTAAAASAVIANNSPPVPLVDYLGEPAPCTAGLGIDIDALDDRAVLIFISTPSARWRDRAKSRLDLSPPLRSALDDVVAAVLKPVRQEAERTAAAAARIAQIEDREERREAEAAARAERSADRERRRRDREERDRAKREAAERLGPVPDVPSEYQPLQDRICATIAEHGGSKSDWLVLRREADPYDRGGERALRRARWFASLVQRTAGRLPSYLRGIYYSIGALIRGVTKHDGERLKLDKDSYDYILDAAGDARWQGLVPFDALEDRRHRGALNTIAHVALPVLTLRRSDQVATILATPREPCLELAAFDRVALARDRQRWSLYIVSEKEGLLSLVETATRRLGIATLGLTGTGSEAAAFKLVQDINARGRPAVVGYISDLDVNGSSMPIELARRFQAHTDAGRLYERVVVVPLAVTPEQVREHKLPGETFEPGKFTDKKRGPDRRLLRFVRLMDGLQKVEADAFAAHPEVLSQIIERVFAPYIDEDFGDQLAEALTAHGQKAAEDFEWARLGAGWTPPDPEDVELARLEANAAIERYNRLLQVPEGVERLAREIAARPVELPTSEPARGDSFDDFASGLAIADTAAPWHEVTRRLRERRAYMHLVGDDEDREADDQEEVDIG